MSGATTIRCEGCGEHVKRRRKDQKTCNRQCWVKAFGAEMSRRVRQTNKAAIADQKMRRRARRYTNQVEVFSRTQVFERDGYVCWICEQACTSESVPAPLAATVDHVVPLRLGGPHTLDNVRCAHFRCNSLRRVAVRGVA